MLGGRAPVVSGSRRRRRLGLARLPLPGDPARPWAEWGS